MNQRYTDDFRSDAVRLVRLGDRSLQAVATDLGVNHWTLRDWVRADPMSTPKKKSKTPAANESLEEKVARLEREQKRLEKENAQLRMDREILKKAAAFFAKESE